MSTAENFVLVPRWLVEDAADKMERYAETVDQCVKADDLEFPHYVPDIQETAQNLRGLLSPKCKGVVTFAEAEARIEKRFAALGGKL